jgi:hypothetical protein
VLRYGAFYGPGGNDEQIGMIRKQMLPIVGAASATRHGRIVRAGDAGVDRRAPLERAVFVSRAVFAFGFPEVAGAVGRSEAGEPAGLRHHSE